MKVQYRDLSKAQGVDLYLLTICFYNHKVFSLILKQQTLTTYIEEAPAHQAVVVQVQAAAPKKAKAVKAVPAQPAPAPPAPVAAPVSDKKQKRKKQPGAPKKPMSAFFCFQMARRAGLKEEAPELNHKDIIKVRYT